LFYTISDINRKKGDFSCAGMELTRKTTGYESGGPVESKTETYYLGIRRSVAKTWSIGWTGAELKLQISVLISVHAKLGVLV
jgi:hypothetical protein